MKKKPKLNKKPRTKGQWLKVYTEALDYYWKLINNEL